MIVDPRVDRGFDDVYHVRSIQTMTSFVGVVVRYP
jgi:hypothetical protein